ncbi:MAG: beta-ketoacyl-[acyl-carrier-protein] synthase II [Dehalococcoidia bacterium]|nr:MAG: beta-ketoacyl-[acyl-carrier-protein] synthase II [Dehalococcoidia bacterium]
MNNRVVVTGIGISCPVGLNASSTWEALIAGKSGIDYITLFDPEPFDTKFAGEVKGFEPTDYISRREARHLDRFAQLAVAASLQAVKQAGIQINPTNQDNIGVIIGSGFGGLLTLSEQIRILLEKGPDKVSPFLAPMMAADMASAQVSIVLGAKGPNFCTASACSSGSDAIGVAYEIIRRGDAQAMLTGGSEAAVTPIGIAAFNALRALSTRNSEPQLASRPFDAEREGFVLSEGAAVLMLEDLAFAQRRGANILAEIIGYGVSSDAYHVTQPIKDGGGTVRAMQMALNKAGLAITEIDYINAHGTSTPLNDKMETKAIKAVFGDTAYHIPISSTKSMMGHLLGGAGAIEAAICIMVIQHGIIPPTINLTHPDPECDLDYVPNIARQAKVTTALSNSFGFGGHNSVLVFRQYCEV